VHVPGGVRVTQPLFDAILADTGITVVLRGVQMPRMNAIMQRWIQSRRLCRSAGDGGTVALFVGVSVPMMDRRSAARRSRYAEYAARTPALLPYRHPRT
jgi:hypothetical protein